MRQAYGREALAVEDVELAKERLQVAPRAPRPYIIYSYGLCSYSLDIWPWVPGIAHWLVYSQFRPASAVPLRALTCDLFSATFWRMPTANAEG